jgi:hypothetical protein
MTEIGNDRNKYRISRNRCMKALPSVFMAQSSSSFLTNFRVLAGVFLSAT